MMRLWMTGSAVTALLFSGVLHGLWTDRWAAAEDLEADLARLQAVPAALGDWVGGDARPQMRPGGEALVSLSRRYVNRRTGDAVTILLACGRPGPVSTHTPDVCYAASGYEVETPAHFSTPTAPGEFFTARLNKKKSAEQTWLRIFWSWNAGDGWQAADNPRLAYSARGRLYKLYLIHELARPNEPPDRDPCVLFLGALLPELQKELNERS
jgi:hypothetical protein